MAAGSRNYFPALDGLRGLAVLFVIAFHYLPIISFGWMGVDLFFVLSGFLITAKLLETLGNPHYLRVFYFRRMLRIFPLYYVVLVFIFLVFPFLKPGWISASYQDLLGQQGHYWLFTANLYDAWHGWPRNISVVHFWSLACEIQFYIIWPLLILLLHRNTFLLAASLFCLILLAVLFRCFAGSFANWSPIYRYVLLPSRIDAFAFGALACLGFKYACRINYTIVLIISSSLLLAGFAYADHWHYSDGFVSRYGLTLTTFFWSALLAYCIRKDNRFFNRGLLSWVGRYSYGMYVFHLPLLIFIAKVMGPSLASAGLALIFTLVCSLLSFHLLEIRALRFKPS